MSPISTFVLNTLTLKKSAFLRFLLGVLLDNYQISHYTETLFPSSEFKTDQIIKEVTLSYGAVVNDTYLEKCFRNLIAEDKYLLYDFIRKELTKTLKVIPRSFVS